MAILPTYHIRVLKKKNGHHTLKNGTWQSYCWSLIRDGMTVADLQSKMARSQFASADIKPFLQFLHMKQVIMITVKQDPIEAALEPAREQARFWAKKNAMDRVNHIKGLLEANGWDRAKACPYPRDMPYGSYKFTIARGLYDDACFLTISVDGRGVSHLHGPCIVKMEQRRINAFIKRHVEETDLMYTAFIAKMLVKIGVCKSATLIGNHVWSHSILTVSKPNGTVEKWKTQQIINQSKLGKVFPQWPSRKVS